MRAPRRIHGPSIASHTRAELHHSGRSARRLASRVTSGKLRAMSQFAFQDIFESDHHEDTPYKKLSSDGVQTFAAGGRVFLEVAPEAISLLTKTAMRDIAHLLRPGHL